jgi:hypothetical protein
MEQSYEQGSETLEVPAGHWGNPRCRRRRRRKGPDGIPQDADALYKPSSARRAELSPTGLDWSD